MPLPEESGLPVASKAPDASRACGHDAHSATTLFAAKTGAQAGLRQGVPKAILQPAEELLAGAKIMLQSGLISDVEEMAGIRLRPIAEVRLGEAAPPCITARPSSST